MTHRFQAPEDCSAVFTSGSGERRADKSGVITLPQDAPRGDHQALRQAGCVPIADEPQAPAKDKPKG